MISNTSNPSSNMKDDLDHPYNKADSIALFRALFEQANDGIFLIKDNLFADCNQKTLDIFELSRDQIVGKAPWELSPEFQSDGERSEEKAKYQIQRAIGEGESKFEWLHSRPDGSIRETVVSLRPITLERETILLAVVRDITQRKRTQAALDESEAYFRHLVESAPIPIYIQTNLRFAYINKAALNIFGASAPEELLGTPVMNRFHENYRDLIAHRIDQIRDHKKDVPSLDQTWVRMDGSLVDVEVCAVPIHFQGVDGALVFGRDITERKISEVALRSAEGMLRTILAASPVGIGLSVNRKMQWVNQAWAQMFGLSSPEECNGLPAEQLYDTKEEFDKAGESLYLNIESGAINQIDTKFRRKDGSIFDGCVRMAVMDRSNPKLGSLAVITDISERKAFEKALAESQAMLNTILEAARIGIGMLKDGRIAWVNRMILEMTGYSAMELIGESAKMLYPNHSEYLRVHQQQDIEVDSRGVGRIETLWQRKDGSIIDVFLTAVPMPGDTFKKNWVCTALDITDRKNAETALARSEEQYRLLIDSTLEAIFIAQDGEIKFANPATEKILGIPKEMFLFKPFSSLIHPDDRSLVTDRHKNRLAGRMTEGPTRYTIRILDQDQAVKWMEIDSVVITWNGKPAALVFGTDVTKRRETEQALRENEERLRAIVEHSTNLFYSHSPSGRLTYVSPQTNLFFDCSPEEALVNWTSFLTENPQNALGLLLTQRAMETGQAQQSYEIEIRTKLGRKLWVEVNESPVTENGKTVAIVGSLTDITQRKKSFEAQRRLATAVEQAEETIIITDPDGVMQYVNPAFERTTGFTREEAIGARPSILKSGEHDTAFYANLWATIRAGKVWKGRFVNQRKDGSFFQEDATISPIRNSDGQIVNLVAVKRDVTQELTLQKQLHHAQKMQAIGTLAGGVAHDFNNLLQVTLGYSELLMAEKDENDPEYGDLNKIYHAAHNGAELVNRLLAFSRKLETKPIPINLNERILLVEKLLKRTIPKMVTMEFDLATSGTEITADPTQIEQLLMNMAVNSSDAMPEGGILKFSTSRVSLDENFCRNHLQLRPGEYVLLQVSDSGQGIDEQVIEHIFEPFYTTKELGRGTGLGLATVYGIVAEHEGLITCESRVGKGTTFDIYFPALTEWASTDTAKTAIMPAFGTETLLLIDDEQFIRELGTRILENAGYRVLTAVGAKEGIELYEREKRAISLVILDLIMPDMSGKACIRQLMRSNPKTKILIASGYSSDLSVRESIDLGARGFVSKPFRSTILLQEVRRILDKA